MKNFKVISITSDLEAYPEYSAASLEYANLVEYIEDDFAVIIINVDKLTDWHFSDDFFHCVRGEYTVRGFNK